MRRLARWLGYGLGTAAILALLAIAGIWLASSHIYSRSYTPRPEPLPMLTAAERAEGPRLARVLGCVECHGPDLRGKMMFDAPNVVKVWSPNLTLIAARASDAQLAQAIRQGVGQDGHSLWIMPSGLYSRLSPREVAALVAAIRQAPRGGTVQPDIELRPLARMGIALGKHRSAPATLADFQAREPFYAGREHEWGRQLSRKICADCHAPDLTGNQPGFEKVPPDLRLAGGYGAEEFTRLMRTGRPPDGRDLGLMRVVSEQGLHALRDDEISAIHGYLKARAERMDR